MDIAFDFTTEVKLRIPKPCILIYLKLLKLGYRRYSECMEYSTTDKTLEGLGNYLNEAFPMDVREIAQDFKTYRRFQSSFLYDAPGYFWIFGITLWRYQLIPNPSQGHSGSSYRRRFSWLDKFVANGLRLRKRNRNRYDVSNKPTALSRATIPLRWTFAFLNEVYFFKLKVEKR